MSRRRDGIRIFPVDPSVLQEHYDSIAPEPVNEARFDALYRALEQLPAAEREVIEQLWLEGGVDSPGPSPRPGAPVAVVAQRMGTARAAIRAIEREAFEHLRKLLEDE